MKNNTITETGTRTPESKSCLLIPGKFCQCPYASLNYSGDSSLAYCAKYHRIMDGWTVMNYCRGRGGCDR